MVDQLRVGVIGTGVMGRDHARILTERVSGAKVTALADVDEGGARALAEELRVPAVFAASTDLLDSGLVDAVIVASPDRFHAATVLECFDRGLPVLCEKPLAATTEEAAAVAFRHSELGTPLLSVGFMRRFDPGYAALRRRIAAGADGRLLMTHSVHRNVEAYPGSDSSATITNSAVHEIDILPWLTGEAIVEVLWAAGRTTTLLAERHDPQLLLLRDASGVLHTVEVQVHAQYGYDVRCELVCESASVELPRVPALVDGEPLVVSSGLQRAVQYPADWRARFAEAYLNELSAWVDASLAGTVPTEAASAEDALRTTRVAGALVESMRRGGWVSVDQDREQA